MSAVIRRALSGNVARNGMLALAGILGANAFNYAYYLMLGRSLSVLEYGDVMALVSSVLVVMSIGTIGQVLIAKLAADLHAAGDFRRLAAFAAAVARLAYASAALVFLFAVVSQRVYASYLHLARPQLVVLAGAAAAIGFVLPLQRGLFQGTGLFSAFAVSTCLDGVIKALLVIPLAHLLGSVGALLAFLGATIGSATYNEFVRRTHFRSAEQGARLDLRRIFYTAGATGASSLAIALLLFYDVVLAKHYLPGFDAGVYGVAALGGRAVFTAVAFLPTVILPEVAQRTAAGRSPRKVLAAAVAFTLIIAGVAAALAGVVPDLLVTILAGRAFLAATPILLPYIVAESALALANLLAIYSIARHRFAFVPWLLAVAVCEISAVVLRHASALQVVQDVLVGHLSIALTASVFVLYDVSRESSKSIVAGTSPATSD